MGIIVIIYGIHNSGAIYIINVRRKIIKYWLIISRFDSKFDISQFCFTNHLGKFSVSENENKNTMPRSRPHPSIHTHARTTRQ